jgi:hypothetical protein
LQCSCVGRTMYIMIDWRLPDALRGGYGPTWLVSLCMGDASRISARMICVSLRGVTSACDHAACSDVMLH